MLKIIAFISMLVDHIGIIYFPDILFFRIVGRLAFPIFAWGIARGYRYTHNYNLYATRLLGLAIISQIPYFLLFNNQYLNVCFTLFAGLLILRLYNNSFSLWINGPLIILILFLAQYFNFEYGIYGILSIFLFFHFQEKDNIIYYYFLLVLISILVFRYDPIQLVSAFSPILILLLHNYNFNINKLFSYSFYPLHLLVLLFI